MKDLQWHEPAAYRRAIYYQNERADPLNSLKFAGVTFLLMLGFRYLVGTGPNPNPPPWPTSILVATAVAVFMAYGVPALMSLLPGSIVILSEKGINNNVMTGRGWSIRFWPWDEIAYCSTAVDTAGGKDYDVITVHDNTGHILATLALSGRPPLAAVEGYLYAHGKKLVHSARV